MTISVDVSDVVINGRFLTVVKFVVTYLLINLFDTVSQRYLMIRLYTF